MSRRRYNKYELGTLGDALLVRYKDGSFLIKLQLRERTANIFLGEVIQQELASDVRFYVRAGWPVREGLKSAAERQEGK